MDAASCALRTLLREAYNRSMNWSLVQPFTLPIDDLWDDDLRNAIARIEALPQNQSGADKTWVEDLLAASDEMARSAVRRR